MKNQAWALMVCVALLSCSSDEGSENITEEKIPPTAQVNTGNPVGGIRIAWDFQTKTQISEEDDSGYNGYARAIQLADGSLLVAYESNGTIVVKNSQDQGLDWSSPILVSQAEEGVNMATPDLIQLQDGSILLTYNPRPGETALPTKRFLIKTILSKDGGSTWQDDQTVYEGGTQFINGVWEPSALQLPSGEIQLFFSNESVYQNSDEQNISLLRSRDQGKTWTKEPEIVSFRAGARDGMPSPLYLKNADKIIFSIEDNGIANAFKPYIIENSIAENWAQTVTGTDEHRSAALREQLDPSEYAGAPYLALLNTGETLLSYQGTDDRNGNDLNNADMKVAIGNAEAGDFNRITTPFSIPEGKSALWNSIAVLDDNTILALATTTAFSAANASEVWMIKGRVIPELQAQKTSLTLDGKTSEAIWEQEFPVFVGQRGMTQLQANIAADGENLYVIAKIRDANVMNTSTEVQDNDGTVLYLDPMSKNYVAPGEGVFKLVVSAANTLKVYQGENSLWKEISIPEIIAKSSVTEEGYIQEIAIPWQSIGERPTAEMGFNMQLTEKGNADYTEVISTASANAPYSWLRLQL